MLMACCCRCSALVRTVAILRMTPPSQSVPPFEDTSALVCHDTMAFVRAVAALMLLQQLISSLADAHGKFRKRSDFRWGWSISGNPMMERISRCAKCLHPPPAHASQQPREITNYLYTIHSGGVYTHTLCSDCQIVSRS